MTIRGGPGVSWVPVGDCEDVAVNIAVGVPEGVKLGVME